MDFTTLTQHFNILVVIACLIVGYIIKTTFTAIPNKYIPTILAVLGSIVNVIVNGVTVESIVYGALMGLASTGMHQAFKSWIETEK